MSKYQNIIFDLDGTLTDSGPGIIDCVQYALSSFGIEETDMQKLRLFVGPPLEDSFMDLYHMSREEALLAIEKYRERYMPIGVFNNTLYPGITDCLKALKEAGKKVYIGTSKPLTLAETVLKNFDIYSCFDYIEGISLDERGTKEEVLSRLLAKLELTEEEKARTIMVGDRFYDVEGAKAVGLNAIGVSYGYGSRPELIEAGAVLVVDDVRELTEELLK